MVSRENAVILVCIAATVAVGIAVDAAGAAYPSWFPVALFVGGGAVLPLAVNGYLDRTGSD